ncbi:nitrous oxide-stimulated promoter family protein [Campylobacter geochelonis]|nr:nitrous oxide-stimulated promoter family protein [Campylobacter geochelonis]CZE48440.1 Nitrous oxide-stimulated promoter [Campylobacter geochelonis]CZE50121.1 Nitrous oxide-stimulated promoter [Campylobacter geochelonis]
MTDEKFIEQNQTVVKFIQLYCDDKHKNKDKKDGILKLFYNGKNLTSMPYSLCDECESLLLYANQRLQNCPHEIKPKCRNCPNPCYEKAQWKQMAKIMRTSGMKLGLIKIKRFFGA